MNENFKDRTQGPKKVLYLLAMVKRVRLGGSNIPTKIQKIDFFKMQPKIVVVLVQGATEHLELSLILQK